MKHVKRIFIVIISVVICATSPHNAVTYAAPTSTLNHNDQGIVWYDNATCSSTGSVELAGDTNIEKILNFFMSKGLSIAQASGFVGNMVQESGNGLDEKVEPKVKNPTPNLEQGGALVDEEYQPKNGTGFGLVQWTWTARQRPLVDKSKELNKPVTDIGVQLEHVWSELNGDFKETLEKVKSVDDPVDAAIMVHGNTSHTKGNSRFQALNPPAMGYEASGDDADGVINVRGRDAKIVYDFYKDSAPQGPRYTNPSTGATESTDPNTPKETSGDGSGKGITVALDPGHGPNHEKIDDASGLQMKESDNQPEGSDVLDVSNRVKTMLENDGYTVVMTKNASPGADISFRDRANVAKDAGASIGVSVHTTPGGEAQNQATPQRMGRYREYNGKRLEFTNQQTAQLSEQYANAIAEARKASEGHNVNTNDIELLRPDIPTKGTIPLVPLYADTVPWVYNEIAQDSGTAISDNLKQKYAEGIYNGIKKANIQSAPPQQADSSCGGGAQGAGTGFDGKLLDYAWETYRGMTLDMKPAYKAAIAESRKAGRYAGDGRGDWGVDCGVFVTHLVRDSGHDPGYNSDGRGGNTVSQYDWTEKNWTKVGNGPIDPAQLAKGDVANNRDTHTYIYVGKVPGFESDIASASWGERAPMAGGNSAAEPGFTWFRKK